MSDVITHDKDALAQDAGYWFSGTYYPATNDGILALQDLLGQAQDRGATNDACAIGHVLAIIAAGAIIQRDRLADRVAAEIRIATA